MAEKRKRAASAPAPAKAPGTPKRKAARTAGGKKGSPEVLAEATITSQEGLRERTEAGHRAAGRTPPSEKTAARQSGAARVIDDSIRSFDEPITEDAKLLQTTHDRRDFRQTDTWRVMRIMGEFIEGFDNLAGIDKG